MSETAPIIKDTQTARWQYLTLLKESCQTYFTEPTFSNKRSITLKDIYCKQQVTLKTASELYDLKTILTSTKEEVIAMISRKMGESLQGGVNAFLNKYAAAQDKDFGQTESFFAILEGQAGVGKTTWCKRLCLAIIDNDIKLTEDMTHHALYDTDCLPLLLSARLFSPNTNEPSNHAFESLAYSASSFSPSYREIISLDVFSQLLREYADTGKLVIIIDGFDELYFSEARAAVIDSLNLFLVRHPRVKLIISTRPGSMELKEINKESFTNVVELVLQPFSKLEVREYCEKWYSTVFSDDPRKANNYSYVISQLESKAFSQFEYMKRSPLLLSILLQLSVTYGRLPTRMIDVYSSSISIMAQWSTMYDARFSTKEYIIQHAYIAYKMTINHQRYISHSELESALLNCFADLRENFANPVQPEEISNYVDIFSTGNCILSSVDSDFYLFPHRQMQQYLTAYAIMNGFGDKEANAVDPIDVIRRHYAKPSDRNSLWDEITLFCVLLGSPRFAHIVTRDLVSISKSINDEEETRDAYNSLLFSFLLGGAILSRDDHYMIYEQCFKEGITNKHVSDICDAFSSNSSLFREIKVFAEAGLQKSIDNGDSDYALLLGLLMAVELANAKEPLLNAIYALQENGDIFSSLVCFSVLSVVAWCDVTQTAGEYLQFVWQSLGDNAESESLQTIFRGALDRYETLPDYVLKSVISSLRQCVIAGWVEDSCIPAIVSNDFIKYLLEGCSDSNQHRIILNRLLDIWPIVPYWAYPHQEHISAPLLENEFLNDFQQAVSSSNSGQIIPIFAFNRCMALGIWHSLDDSLDALDKVLTMPYDSADEDGARIEQVLLSLRYCFCSIIGNDEVEGIRIFISPTISELSLENISNILNERKMLYPYEYNSPFGDGLADLSYNNYGYLLRRNEIQCQLKDRNHFKNLDALFFLAPFANRNNPFVLVNYALFQAGFNNGNNGDYEIGLDILRDNMPISDDALSSIFHWWWDVAEAGELEGLVVLLWLYQISASTPIDENNDTSLQKWYYPVSDMLLILDAFEDKIGCLAKPAIDTVAEIRALAEVP